MIDLAGGGQRQDFAELDVAWNHVGRQLRGQAKTQLLRATRGVDGDHESDQRLLALR